MTIITQAMCNRCLQRVELDGKNPRFILHEAGWHTTGQTRGGTRRDYCPDCWPYIQPK